jgi:hypothetical protein
MASNEPMYRIIGADQKEYGPVGARRVKEWIAEGRANGDTRIRLEESPEWRVLSHLPEFAASLGVKRSPGPGLPPRGVPLEADRLAEEILARDYHLEIGRCVGRAWDVIRSNFWPAVGASFLVLLLQGALECVPFLGPAANLILGGVFLGGLYYFFLKLVRRQPAEIGDAFAGFRIALVPLMLAGVVSTLLTTVGLVLCLVPGIYLAVAWVFALPLVADKGLDFWPAMELSRKVVTKHWWTILGLQLINLMILLAGVLCCVVGVFVAVPVTCAAIACAYEEIFGAQAAPALAASAPGADVPAPPSSPAGQPESGGPGSPGGSADRLGG